MYATLDGDIMSDEKDTKAPLSALSAAEASNEDFHFKCEVLK